MIKSKIRAAILHGLITVFVAVMGAIVIYRVWFPGDLAAMMRGGQLYGIVLGVEVFLGPVMSLVVYNASKPFRELVVDYSVIGSVQLLALVYGLYAVSISRPVFIVFVKDRLEVVSAVELEPGDLANARDKVFRSLSWWGPKMVCVESPTDPYEKSELLQSALDGKDIQLLPKYYRGCDVGEITSKAYGKEQLEIMTSIRLSDLPVGVVNATFKWLPVVSRFDYWTVLYKNGNLDEPVYINADPFKS